MLNLTKHEIYHAHYYLNTNNHWHSYTYLLDKHNIEANKQKNASSFKHYSFHVQYCMPLCGKLGLSVTQVYQCKIVKIFLPISFNICLIYCFSIYRNILYFYVYYQDFSYRLHNENLIFLFLN